MQWKFHFIYDENDWSKTFGNALFEILAPQNLYKVSNMNVLDLIVLRYDFSSGHFKEKTVVPLKDHIRDGTVGELACTDKI